jgi:type II secretory pathway pseudopilin PulG
MHVHSQSGIAIGPILFVIAILGLLAAVMAAGFGDFGVASIADRVAADVQSQASLIRTKINECNIKYGTASNFDGFPSSDATNGTLVSALDCSGDQAGLQNLWAGERATTLPPPTTGFGQWYYINTNGIGLGGTPTGGRCIWIQPTGSNPSGNSGLIQGLSKAASKFTNQTTCNSAATCGATEVIYNPASSSQKFILWISVPTGAPDSHCLP